MWQQWRAAIDAAIRDARRVETEWPDMRTDLRNGSAEGFRVYSLTTTRSQARRMPRRWRLRLSAARMRPIL